MTGNVKSIKILLVEDNLPDVYYLKELLSEAECVFFLKNARSLSDAIALLVKEHFDLVLLDLDLPDSHGIHTAVHLRQQSPSIPIVVLTGIADEELAFKSLQMDIQDYLIIGQINRDQLVRSIRYAIERKQVTEALREREERYRSLFNSIDEGYCVIEMRIEPDQPLDYRFIEVNHSFENQSTLKDVEGKWMRDLRPDHEDSWFEIYRDVALTGKPIRFEQCSKALKNRCFTLYAFRIGPPEQRRVAVLFNDITEQKRMEEEIKRIAYHDYLTGLPNRRLFLDIVNLRVAEARRNINKLAILYMDLDKFKEVNDTFGHETGDELLKEVAKRLKLSIRESDTVARVGGDEFNIILSNITHTEDITTVAQKIIDSFHENFIISGHEFHITTSIGIGIYPDDSEEIEALFRYADQAMYKVKEMGRNTFQFYNNDINLYSLERRKLERRLRRSIELGELEMYYQPQIDIKTGKIVCAEALVRWNHPDMILIESNGFIDVAEETGFIAIIDEWVLKAVCAQLKTWMDNGMQSLRFTVNLSARQFENPELPKKIAHILNDTGVPPDWLTIEIKENIAMNNTKLTTARLIELTKLGIHISLDDFGTGYSSLNYLRRLPLENLKINQTLIRDIAADPDSRLIINAIVSMAHNLNLNVTAVGVEEENQLSFLRETECNEAQGYYFSKPLPAQEFVELLAMAT
jgi:diguanylate cyclase (GGDEF)-like protein